MENLDELKQVLEGGKHLARTQNLIELYGKCAEGSNLQDLVGKALIEEFNLDKPNLEA